MDRLASQLGGRAVYCQPPLLVATGVFVYCAKMLKRGRAAMRKTEQHHPTIMRLPVKLDVGVFIDVKLTIIRSDDAT